MPEMTIGESPGICVRWMAQAFSPRKLMSFGYRMTNEPNNKIIVPNRLKNTADDYVGQFQENLPTMLNYRSSRKAPESLHEYTDDS